MTQAYSEGDLTFGDNYWAEHDPKVSTDVGMQDRTRDNYVKMTAFFNVEVSPAGDSGKYLTTIILI